MRKAMIKRQRNCFVLASLAVMLSAVSARGDIITYTESVLGPGSVEYDYVVTNPLSQAGANLYDVIFNFGRPAQMVDLPIGWDLISDPLSIETFSTNVGPPPF